jgi:hypothetical protein
MPADHGCGDTLMDIARTFGMSHTTRRRIR